MVKLENVYHEKVANDMLDLLNGDLRGRLSYSEKVYLYLKHLKENTNDAFNIFTNTLDEIERG